MDTILVVDMGMHALRGQPGLHLMVQVLVPGLEERARMLPALVSSYSTPGGRRLGRGGARQLRGLPGPPWTGGPPACTACTSAAQSRWRMVPSCGWPAPMRPAGGGRAVSTALQELSSNPLRCACRSQRGGADGLLCSSSLRPWRPVAC